MAGQEMSQLRPLSMMSASPSTQADNVGCPAPSLPSKSWLGTSGPHGQAVREANQAVYYYFFQPTGCIL